MNNNNTQFQNLDLGSLLLRLGGVFLAFKMLDAIFDGSDKDTVNYTLKHRGRKVYHGITYEDRLECRLIEHELSGKKFDDYTVSQPRSRKTALKIERRRIQRDRTKYNVHHNC